MNSSLPKLQVLDGLEVKGRRVLLRVDLNVPMEHGRVTDDTRLKAVIPTITELAGKGAKVILLSHFGRPQGKFTPSFSLAPLVDVLADALAENGTPYNVHFGVDVLGEVATRAVEKVQNGEVLLFENLRFHAEEEANGPAFARALAALGEIFVNDAFSVSHRAHASVTGVAEFLPAYAGRLLQREVEAISALLQNPARPLMAVVGGAKISTKLAILEHLVEKVDVLAIGGAMANTFLLAQGGAIGNSLAEPDLQPTAQRIMEKARNCNCRLLLPRDFLATKEFAPSAAGCVVDADAIPNGMMQLDIGPESVQEVMDALREAKSLLWNGPFGAFEMRPYGAATSVIARLAAARTRKGELFSIAGGGDTVAALHTAGLAGEFSYLSTAGGAFLEMVEGKTLPGIAALLSPAGKLKKGAG